MIFILYITKNLMYNIYSIYFLPLTFLQKFLCDFEIFKDLEKGVFKYVKNL